MMASSLPSSQAWTLILWMIIMRAHRPLKWQTNHQQQVQPVFLRWFTLCVYIMYSASKPSIWVGRKVNLDSHSSCATLQTADAPVMHDSQLHMQRQMQSQKCKPCWTCCQRRSGMAFISLSRTSRLCPVTPLCRILSPQTSESSRSPTVFITCSSALNCC